MLDDIVLRPERKLRYVFSIRLGVPQFGMRKRPGDLANHRGCRGDCHFVLGNAGPHGRNAGPTADLADTSAFLDERNLLIRLDRAHPHGRCADMEPVFGAEVAVQEVGIIIDVVM